MTATGDAMNEEAVVTRVLADYYDAFSTLEVHAVLPYFHEPSVLIGPQGLLAAPTYAVLTTAFTPAMEVLRARGFGRSEPSVRNVKSLSATPTLVTGVALGADPPRALIAGETLGGEVAKTDRAAPLGGSRAAGAVASRKTGCNHKHSADFPCNLSAWSSTS
jgi:hypothetical protein